MVEITTSYGGDLCCMAAHGPSGSSLSTDAPRDNQGLGRYFSPTDLVATALATCALTTMALVGRKHGIELKGATARVVKHMVADPRRRIGALPLEFTIPGALTAEQKALLEETARTCPVSLTLRPEVDVPMSFAYPDG